MASVSLLGNNASQRVYYDNKSMLSKCFRKAIDTIVAIATEIFALTIYFPYLFSKGKTYEFHNYGLNPKSLSAEQVNLPAVIFLHGDKHNQSGILPLARKIDAYIKKYALNGLSPLIGPVFTVNLNYDDENPATHQAQLHNRILEIKRLYNKKDKSLDLIIVGHSKGAIEAADYAYRNFERNLQEKINVKKVISLAGRLRVVPSKMRRCHPTIKNQVDAIYSAIQMHPEIPLYNIVAGKDWIVPRESALINREAKRSLIIENRSHLGLLSNSKALNQIISWLAI